MTESEKNNFMNIVAHVSGAILQKFSPKDYLNNGVKRFTTKQMEELNDLISSTSMDIYYYASDTLAEMQDNEVNETTEEKPS